MPSRARQSGPACADEVASLGAPAIAGHGVDAALNHAQLGDSVLAPIADLNRPHVEETGNQLVFDSEHFGGVIYSDMFKTFALVERIRQEVEALGALAIIVDTSVGYFEGGDANVRATPRA